MTADTSTFGDAAAEARVTAEEITPLRRFYWSLRREVWESRSLYLAPLGVAALILLGWMIGAFQLPETMRAAAALAPAKRHETIVQPYLFAELLLMGVIFFIGIFYTLDALQGERRDRSILFWKSLPVSDATTVLAKASIPMAILPLFTIVLAMVTQVFMLLISSAVVLADGQDVATLWSQAAVPEMWGMLVYHMIVVHGLSYAPLYAWLLLVSAWAPRVPWLWAILPPLAIAIIERIAFGTSHFAHSLAMRIAGGAEGSDLSSTAGAMDQLMPMAPMKFLLSPGLWLGLAVAAVFVAAAIRLRRRRGPV